MTTAATAMSVRRCIDEVLAAISRHGKDATALGEAMSVPVRRLMERPDLLTLGVPREGNNVAFSQYLYFDGELSMLLYEVPKGKVIPPHDHGIWESMFIYRGRVKHTVYRRADDGKVPGYAELAVVADRVLGRGDHAVVAPPADIHSFTALDDGTYGITIVDGAYKDDRHYYQPEQKTYLVRRQKNAR